MEHLHGFLEGGLASVIAGCSTHPLDLVKVRLQLQGESLQQLHLLRPTLLAAAASPHASSAAAWSAPTIPHAYNKPPGMAAVAASIARSEGLAGLFSGVSATVLRQSLYSTTRMGLYEALKTHWAAKDGGDLAVGKKVAAGLVAGGVGAAVGNPADVAMVRMQADGRLPPAERRNYRGVKQALAQMVREEGGVAALWRGSALTVQRAMVVTAAQLATYDTAKEALRRRGRGEGLSTHLAASCTAGLVAALASNPLDVLKTRVMNNGFYSGAIDCLVKTVKAEGPLALYKGFFPTVMRQGPFTVVLFLSLEQIRRLTSPPPPPIATR